MTSVWMISLIKLDDMHDDDVGISCGKALLEEDRVYFWRKAVKASKKVPENRKKYWKFGRKPENAIKIHGKLKTNLRKAGKSRPKFFLRKAGNRPPIPGPLTGHDDNMARALVCWCGRKGPMKWRGVWVCGVDWKLFYNVEHRLGNKSVKCWVYNSECRPKLIKVWMSVSGGINRPVSGVRKTPFIGPEEGLGDLLFLSSGDRC